MTSSKPSRPLLPVLGRMALGLGVASVGALITWQGITVKPTPGMSTTVTTVNVPLDGPLPLDLAETASFRLEGDRINVSMGSLNPKSQEIVSGQVMHRVRNPVQLDATRTGRQVNTTLKMHVQALNRSGVVVTEPEPVQHTIDLNFTRLIPLTLSGRTTDGNLNVNLEPLRLRALNLRSGRGNQIVALPGRTGGPFSLVSNSGDISITAPPGANPEALRVNTTSGDLHLELGTVSTQTLGLGTDSGDVQVTLPTTSQRGIITTNSGNVSVTAQRGTTGNLDIRTQSGSVSLNAPRDMRLRVRFTDRDTLTLPANMPPGTAPDLDVFIDAPSDNFSLETTEGTAIPLPEPIPNAERSNSVPRGNSAADSNTAPSGAAPSSAIQSAPPVSRPSAGSATSGSSAAETVPTQTVPTSPATPTTPAAPTRP